MGLFWVEDARSWIFITRLRDVIKKSQPVCGLTFKKKNDPTRFEIRERIGFRWFLLYHILLGKGAPEFDLAVSAELKEKCLLFFVDFIDVATFQAAAIVVLLAKVVKFVVSATAMNVLNDDAFPFADVFCKGRHDTGVVACDIRGFAVVVVDAVEGTDGVASVDRLLNRPCVGAVKLAE